MFKRILTAGLAIGGLSLMAAAAAPAQAAGPQKVIVMNNTRFAPLAEAEVIPAGQTRRFEVRSDNFGRVSVLVGGAAATGGGDVTIGTVFGLPFVPGTPPRALHLDADGNIRDRLLEPVLGPLMVILVRNDTAADATITLSAYFAN